MQRDDERPEEHPEDLPQALIDELRAADRGMPLITTRVDHEMERLARAHFAGRRARVRLSGPAWTAIAAAVLLAVIAVQRQAPQSEPPAPVYADVDGSGRIDIADVLVLARSKDGDGPSQDELDAFAMRIVALGGDTS